MKVKHKESFWSYFKNHKMLYFMMLPMLAFLFAFNYLPIWGLSLAFREYVPGMPLFPWMEGITWVGLKNFIALWKSIYTLRYFLNTLILSIYLIIFGFFPPIIFALFVNEIVHRKYKRVVQTVSYLPYFISTAIVGGLVVNFLGTNGGVVNQIIELFGGTPTMFLNDTRYFRTIYVVVHIWKNFGWGSILYLAAISSINPELYEAVRIDGGGRWRQMWHITLPGIKPTIFILMVLGMGGILGGGDIEMIRMLWNRGNMAVSSTMAFQIFRDGILASKYAQATALGLLVSVVGLITTVSVNAANRKLTGFSLW